VSRWKISADTGGTFTDCILEDPEGKVTRGKVLSSGRLRTRITRLPGGNRIEVEPFDYPGREAIVGKPVTIAGNSAGRLADAEQFVFTVEAVPEAASPGDMLEIDSGWEAPVLAMRLLFADKLRDASGSLSFRLGTTKGTNTLLENKGAPVALFLSAGFEDLLMIRDQKRPDIFAREITRPAPIYRNVYGLHGRLDTRGEERQGLEERDIRESARRALESGCTVAAVCLLNSWINPAHEQRVGEILAECGFETIRLSSTIRPLIKYLDRTETTLVDATLSPVMDHYLDRVQAELGKDPLWVMTSAGGLVSRARFHAVDSLVSGPAGGVLGAVASGRQAGLEKIIALDMGGTSTDVSRWKDHLELRQQIRVGHARILTPAMPIETVAAGGGSICGFDGERLTVGPESAGADPGPAAYGAGGPLTLTDIHLLLGRIDPDGFSIPIRTEASRSSLAAVAEASGEADWPSLAEGFLSIATERMAHAIRQVSLREGEDPARYGLVAFGGAGGLHACRVAAELGMTSVVFPPDAGILSAQGIHTAPREAVVDRQFMASLEEAEPRLHDAFSNMEADSRNQLHVDGVAPDRMDQPECTAFLRLAGQESGIPVEWSPDTDIGSRFREKFVAIFGYFPKNASVEVVKLRLRLLETSEPLKQECFEPSGECPDPDTMLDGYIGGEACSIPVFQRERLSTGALIAGPAVIRDPFGTAFIEPGWEGVLGTAGSIRVSRKESGEAAGRDSTPAKVEKALVLNRLEGLVEEMGDQLRRTALSTNIRERLDFSCALLDAKGRLLVNAPHIPVHLGAMGLCVRECLKGYSFKPGDVLVTNHPGFGGSHLPDVTLMCGLFDTDERLLGFLANRAHHAELGGKSPGSMPADATCLEEEGVIIRPQWLIHQGKDRFETIEQLLLKGRFPTRAVRENRIDLEAQFASLRRGVDLFGHLLRDYPGEVISGYFGELYRMGADALGGVLKSGRLQNGKAKEELDDGRRIEVAIRVHGDGLCIDFSGTSETHPGNLNATPAIVRSAVLYVLRILVEAPLPLNEGLLDRVRINLPRCFLNPAFPDEPSACPAVVGGNVETSQRIVDALVRAIGLMAASQGTMNNLLFGNNRFGYYETIGGGAGASDGSPGASGVHVHMTNTAITDAEVLEQRFPVVCREFSLRKGSGGDGRFGGGDGLVREIQFLEPVSVSILSQNRVRGARGMSGGDDGMPGRQWIVRNDGTREPVDGHAQVELEAGEAIRIETPGGGGWGTPG
jgi:5-oxoprolinase (ATP-hydrolysing)